MLDRRGVAFQIYVLIPDKRFAVDLPSTSIERLATPILCLVARLMGYHLRCTGANIRNHPAHEGSTWSGPVLTFERKPFLPDD